MRDEEFRLHGAIEGDHWWFVGKREILRALLDAYPLPRRLLDLGCGTGGVLRDWMARCPCFGVDRSERALAICRDKGFATLVRSDLYELPFSSQAFDIILVLDVIEHLQDDAAFLKGIRHLCQPDGRIVVSVPAFQAIWSQHDETFHHLRRYRSKELREVISNAGFEVERITYTNAIVFPLVALWRILSYRMGLGRFAPEHDFWRLPRWIEWLLIRVYYLEARLLTRLDLPFGVSVVCIARRGQ